MDWSVLLCLFSLTCGAIGQEQEINEVLQGIQDKRKTSILDNKIFEFSSTGPLFMLLTHISSLLFNHKIWRKA